jgi:hypothetical protein
MLKKLFSAGALLVPVLAYAGNPTGDLSIQIVPAGSTPTVPAAAQAAGLTTLAYNADFSTSAYATKASPGSTNQAAGWLGCIGDPNYNSQHEFSLTSIFSGGGCNVQQTTDPDFAGTVLNIYWLAGSDPSTSRFAQTQISSSPANGSASGGVNFPKNSYIEATFRAKTTLPPGTPSYANAGPTFGVPGGTAQWWSGTYNADGAGYEVDFMEPYWAWIGPSGHILDSAGGSLSGPQTYGFGFGTYDFTQYHTWGTLQQWNGSTFTVTPYLDNVAVASPTSVGNNGGERVTDRRALNFTAGISCTFSPTDNQRNSKCTNAPISSVFDCNGAICIITPSDNNEPSNTNQSVVITGATSSNGVLAGILNKQWGKSQQISQSPPTWQLAGSTWPGNADSYNSNSGTMNPYQRIDMYIKSVRVWSCANWANSQCIGGQ